MPSVQKIMYHFCKACVRIKIPSCNLWDMVGVLFFGMLSMERGNAQLYVGEDILFYREESSVYVNSEKSSDTESLKEKAKIYIHKGTPVSHLERYTVAEIIYIKPKRQVSKKSHSVNSGITDREYKNFHHNIVQEIFYRLSVEEEFSFSKTENINAVIGNSNIQLKKLGFCLFSSEIDFTKLFFQSEALKTEYLWKCENLSCLLLRSRPPPFLFSI